MGKASDLSAIEKSKIITMRESGSSYRVISKSVGRSVTAVKNVLDCFQKEKVLVSGRKTRCENELKISKKTARYLYLLSKRSRRKTLPVLSLILRQKREIGYIFIYLFFDCNTNCYF